jgi:hypothetical protein
VSSISVHVDAPEGLPKPFVSLSYKPATTDEFEQLVEALGGPSAFRLSYNGSGAFVMFDDGTTLVHVEAPTDAEPAKPARHPFMQAFEQRIKAASGGES